LDLSHYQEMDVDCPAINIKKTICEAGINKAVKDIDAEIMKDVIDSNASTGFTPRTRPSVDPNDIVKILSGRVVDLEKELELKQSLIEQVYQDLGDGEVSPKTYGRIIKAREDK
jgi:hypothetical protein